MYCFNHHYLRIVLGALMLMTWLAHGQPATEPQHIEICFTKTSSIIFPALITSVDRGSRDVLAQKVKGVNNVLQVKAGRMNFKETNLTVITADGKLHHFFVRYSEHPSTFTIQATAPGDTANQTNRLLFQPEMTTPELEQSALAIIASPRKMRLKSTAKNDMVVSLQGIYIRDNIMFYHLKVTNKSNIPYHTELLRFYIRDQERVTRTASQEVSEVPLYHYGQAEVIEGKAQQDLVYALPKFTIPDAKVLIFELMEKRGGRHLQLHLKNRVIIRAKPVPEI